MNLEVHLAEGEITINIRELHPVDYDSARRLARDLATDLTNALSSDVDISGDGTA